MLASWNSTDLNRERESYFTTGGLPPISSSWRQAPWVPRPQFYCPLNPQYIPSGRTQQKTSLPATPLLFHNVTISADPQRTPFPAVFLFIALRGVTYSIVASLFIVPKPSNGHLFRLIYSSFQRTCHSMNQSALTTTDWALQLCRHLGVLLLVCGVWFD
jgi:hypothetical protein